MKARPLGNTGIEIAPLVFGGNVFGWTIDESTSFALLDRFVDRGFCAIDTADCYQAFAPGNEGGESETIIGRWLRRTPGRRAKVVIITKVGIAYGPHKGGLSPQRILEAVEGSLARLQTDYIDLYLSHTADPHTPIEETLGTYQKLLNAGNVRAIGASNHSAAQMREALAAVDRGLPRYEVLEPEYNLYDRGKYEGELRELRISERLGVITYFSLASGFLSGKHGSKHDLAGSVRGAYLAKYFDARGERILDALRDVAHAHHTVSAAVALAWLMAREGVTAPIASATSVQQIDALMHSAGLALSASEMEELNRAGAKVLRSRPEP